MSVWKDPMNKKPRRSRSESIAGSAEPELLPGEKIEFEDTEAKALVSDEELNRRYVKGETRIVTETARYSLANILLMLRETVPVENSSVSEKRYRLDPEYQRRHRWSNARKSRLIESFLLNVPVPPVFLYERDLARFEVMDGRQRLTAISEFYENKLKLEGLQHWTDLHGRTYSTLPSKVRDGIDRRYISSIILLKETASTEEQAATLKKLVFERLNSGGVALSSQETRNAVYDGPLNQLCLMLSRNPDFQKMWGITAELPIDVDDDGVEITETEEKPTYGQIMFQRMEDVELVLRFFAYRQIHKLPNPLNKISIHLDRFLISGNKFSPTVLAEYETMFEETASFLFQVLGVDAFYRLPQLKRASNRPTKIVYDPLMFVACQYAHGPAREVLLAGKEVLLAQLGEMYDTKDELFSGRRTNSADIQKRNSSVAQAFHEALIKLKG